MNIVGKILAALGVLVILKAITMDIALKGSDYVNMGLLSDRQNFIILGALLIIVGVILFAISTMNNKNDNIDKNSNKSQKNGNNIAASVLFYSDISQKVILLSLFLLLASYVTPWYEDKGVSFSFVFFSLGFFSVPAMEIYFCKEFNSKSTIIFSLLLCIISFFPIWLNDNVHIGPYLAFIASILLLIVVLTNAVTYKTNEPVYPNSKKTNNASATYILTVIAIGTITAIIGIKLISWFTNT